MSIHRTLSGLACVLAFAAASLGMIPSAFALDCGSRLVIRGDRAAYVRTVCGEPQSATTRTETRTVGAYNQLPGGPVFGGFNIVTVQIDTWIYDFGPSRFMEELIFENGVLTSSRPIGPGTPRPPRRGRASRKVPEAKLSACRSAHEP